MAEMRWNLARQEHQKNVRRVELPSVLAFSGRKCEEEYANVRRLKKKIKECQKE